MSDTLNALDVLDAVYSLMAKARAVKTMIGTMSDDIKHARDAGLITASDEPFLVPHSMACASIDRAIALLGSVLSDCELEPSLLGLSHHQGAVAAARQAMAMAHVLVGDVQEYADSAGPEDHL